MCGRVYPTNSTLRAHSITHSNVRPHKCPMCDKTFKRNQDLKVRLKNNIRSAWYTTVLHNHFRLPVLISQLIHCTWCNRLSFPLLSPQIIDLVCYHFSFILISTQEHARINVHTAQRHLLALAIASRTENVCTLLKLKEIGNELQKLCDNEKTRRSNYTLNVFHILIQF